MHHIDISGYILLCPDVCTGLMNTQLHLCVHETPGQFLLMIVLSTHTGINRIRMVL